MTTNKPKVRRRKEGYVQKSPAICMVVYDPTGKPLSDEVTSKMLNHITEIALENRYFINFTRT